MVRFFEDDEVRVTILCADDSQLVATGKVCQTTKPYPTGVLVRIMAVEKPVDGSQDWLVGQELLLSPMEVVVLNTRRQRNER